MKQFTPDVLDLALQIKRRSLTMDKVPPKLKLDVSTALMRDGILAQHARAQQTKRVPTWTAQRARSRIV